MGIRFGRGRARTIAVVIVAVSLALSGCRGAEPGPSTSGNETIRLGGSFPFSGGLAISGALSKGVRAYFEKINAEGGINGRKIDYRALDDGYDPSRLASNARQLVEQDNVLALMSFGGTNLAIRDYMKGKKVPHFVLAGNAALSDTQTYPDTRAWWPDIRLEGAITAHFILAQNPSAKVGVLGYNNDITTSQIEGIKAGLGDKASSLVATETYPVTATDLSAQLGRLKAAGVDTIVAALGGPVGINALQYLNQIGWKPQIYNYSIGSASFSLTSKAGAAGVGLRGVQWLKDPADKQWANDEWIKSYKDAVQRYGDGTDSTDMLVLNGYAYAEALCGVLKTMGVPTREGLVQAWDKVTSINSGALLPGIVLNTGSDGRLIHSYRLTTWDGSTWKVEGEVIDGLKLGLLK